MNDPWEKGEIRQYDWQPIATAPLDQAVWVYAPEYEGLPAITCIAQYDEDAGWCVDELREVIAWFPVIPPPPFTGF